MLSSHEKYARHMLRDACIDKMSDVERLLDNIARGHLSANEIASLIGGRPLKRIQASRS